MPAQDNVLAARRLLEEAFAGGDLSVVDELVADDFIEHQEGVQGIGQDAAKHRIRRIHAALGGLRYAIEAVVAGRDTVWLRSHVFARNTGSVMGWPATGREVEVDVIDVFRFSGGKAVEHWGVADRLGLLEQLGLEADDERRIV
jgi:predicted ester cyclase